MGDKKRARLGQSHSARPGANARCHGTTRRIVAEAFSEEQPSLAPLPALAFRAILKLERRITEDVEAAFESVQAQEIAILFPIVEADAGLRTFGIRDPEGNIVQFFGSR